MNKFLEKAKNSYFGEGKNNKKKIENLIVLLIILIITFIAVNRIWNGDEKTKEETEVKQNTTTGKQLATNVDNNEDNNNNDLQTKLENILAKIDGVGKVNILLTYSESSELIPLYDETTSQTTTEEADTSGGKRTTTDTSTQKAAIMQEESSGQKNIITQKTVSPKIEGAIITAERRR